MDEDVIRIVLLGIGFISVGVMIFVLQKMGILPKILNGEYWNSGQDKMQHNDVTF